MAGQGVEQVTRGQEVAWEWLKRVTRGQKYVAGEGVKQMARGKEIRYLLDCKATKLGDHYQPPELELYNHGPSM